MATTACWALKDPQIGISLWSTKDDALQVARFRKCLCRIEPYTAKHGDVVSTLGAPDVRIRED